MLVSEIRNTRYFVAKFTNTAGEAEMLEKTVSWGQPFLCQPDAHGNITFAFRNTLWFRRLFLSFSLVLLKNKYIIHYQKEEKNQ